MNPLMQTWTEHDGLPPFAAIKPEHFGPAFEAALAAHRAEVEAIANNATAASFDNTVNALDAAGRDYVRVTDTFSNLNSSNSNPQLQALESEWMPKFAAHDSAMMLNEKLFARIESLYQQRATLGLDVESLRLLERFRLQFLRSGALLKGPQRARFAQIVESLAKLTTQFSQNVLADESSFTMPLGANDLEGLPDFFIAAAAEAARSRGLEGYVVVLSRSSYEPFMTFSKRRDLREKAWRAFTQRGEHEGAHDNRLIAPEILALRHELAQLLGYQHFAEYALADRMAKTPEAANRLLLQTWVPALKAVHSDKAELEALARSLGEPTPVAAWDWLYLSEKVRQTKYAIDETEVKPYFSLERMIAAMFDVAHRLFGLVFTELKGITLYHPDARIWRVEREANGVKVAVGFFLGDNFARPHKQGGAWMSAFRKQSRLGGKDIKPIIINNNNFAKGAAGAPTLLSFDDVRTLFHEFGHGLHGLLSNVRFETLSGTSVLRDFVELPSQLMENWAPERELLKKYALHVDTGAPIPDTLIDRLEAARKFGQAWSTVQYVSSALVDLALHGDNAHVAEGMKGVDITAFERAECARIGLPTEVGMRHRLPHFNHLFSGEYYAAGYYVYLWAEVLDADAFAAFKESGNVFDPVLAKRLYECIYSSGNRQDPAQAYRDFRGRDAKVEPMLEARGLLETA